MWSYDCLPVSQRSDSQAPKFVMFAAPAKDVLEWAAIDRLTSQTPDGHQRIDKPYKIKSIAAFFKATIKNTIPTAIIIGFRSGTVQVEPLSECEQARKLTIQIGSSADKPGTIIDGQHRVLGMNAFNATMPVNIVAMLDVDDVETAFQFLVINNKAARVSSDHLRALALNYSAEDLEKRLKSVRLDLDQNLRFVGFANTLDESPFKGILSLPSNPPESQWVSPAAIEDSANYIKQQKLREFDDDDMLLDLFFAIWASIKERWPHLWQKDSKLFQKVSIVCLTQYFVDNVLSRYDWGDLDIFQPDEVEKEVKKILGVLDSQFWDSSTEWTAKGLDTQNGRSLFLKSLEQMLRNSRQKVPWFTDITMISIKS